MTRKAVRQGDVLLWPADTVPPTTVPVGPEEGRLIVARGEATGHHHSFPHRRGAVLFRDDAAGGALWVTADAPVALEHQEHTALTVGPGAYRVRIQRTMSAGLVRRVED